VRVSGAVEHGGSFLASQRPGWTDVTRPVLVETDVVVRHGDTALDELGVDSFSFAKIDVEGHEHAVISGLWRRIERDRPPLLMEVLPGKSVGRSSIEAMLNRLSSAGYRPVLDDEENDRWRPLSWPEIGERTAEKGQDVLLWHEDGVSSSVAKRLFSSMCEHSGSRTMACSEADASIRS
jgi:hypothetical protein